MRLSVRCCPRCHQESLVSTGSFWDCHDCRYVVTTAALTVDLFGPSGLSRPLGSLGKRTGH
jgi:ribosomal protein L37AE/L43A